MESNNNILIEILEVAPTLAIANKALPYTVPTTYFNTFSTEVLSTISENILPKVNAPFAVPDNYFAQLSTNVLFNIDNELNLKVTVNEELMLIAPLLTTINKNVNYSIPNNYFNTLIIPTTKSVAKIIKFKSVRKWVVYVAAACVIGFVAVGGYIFNNHKSSIDYTAYKKIDINNSINKISNEELINYLENENTITNANSFTTLDTKLPDVQNHLQTIPDEDLKQYLKESVMPVSDDDKDKEKDGI